MATQTQSRIDPISDDEWLRIRAELPLVLRAKAFGSVEALGHAIQGYSIVFDALWATGAHPSVFEHPERSRVNVRDDDEGSVMEWRRPKTKRVCAMPLEPHVADALRVYLYGKGPWPRYSTRSILRVMREAAEQAGVPDVTPKTIRHTVGFRLFKAHGPTVAKDSLGVSDRVLQDYLRLTDKARMKAIRDGMKSDRNSHRAVNTESDTTDKEATHAA